MWQREQQQQQRQQQRSHRQRLLLLLLLLCLQPLLLTSFSNTSLLFDVQGSSSDVQVPISFTLDFATDWPLSAGEMIMVKMPRFTRRLKEERTFSTPSPSSAPTYFPTKPPGYSPMPSPAPSPAPTPAPTRLPTSPSPAPTPRPSASPTTGYKAPSFLPTAKPTPSPSTAGPTFAPTFKPTTPTGQPTRQPSAQPTGKPSRQPSRQPSGQPSGQPSMQPSRQPSGQPSRQPTVRPTKYTVTSNNIAYNLAGTGTTGYSGDGGLATSANINAFDISIDPATYNIYIADSTNNRIRLITRSTGIISTVAGNGTAGYWGDLGQATSAMIKGPRGVAFDPLYQVFYIADYLNARVRMVTLSTGVITNFAGTGTSGHTGDSGLATAASIRVSGVTVDSSGNLYIADYYSAIRKVTKSTLIITTVAGSSTSGITAGNGLLATSTSIRMGLVTKAVLDASGNIYIADYGNSVIRKVTASTGLISTIAGNGTAGYDAYDDVGRNATLCAINKPRGLAVTNDSKTLYIADSSNSRVRKVDLTTNIMTTIVGSGTSNVNGVAALSASCGSNAVVLDGNNNLYLSCSNRIKEIRNMLPTSAPSPLPTPSPTSTNSPTTHMPTNTRAPTMLYQNFSSAFNLEFGQVRISPSSLFLASWTEGDWRNYNSSSNMFKSEYPIGTLALIRNPLYNGSFTIPINSSIKVKVYAVNGIGAYCGFPNSTNPDSTNRPFSTSYEFKNDNFPNMPNQDAFVITSNFTDPNNYHYEYRSWPAFKFSGFKDYALPNVTRIIQNYNGLGAGCVNSRSSGSGDGGVNGFGVNDGCNGNGVCDYCANKCACFQGYGAETDIVQNGRPIANDCSNKVCPAGRALVDVSKADNSSKGSISHNAHSRLAECSNAGNCDRSTGTCSCYAPWTGAACDRMSCPNECSGHGVCLSMRAITRLASITGSTNVLGLYFHHSIEYGDILYENNNLTTVAQGESWDHDVMHKCVCDSSWPVGLDAGQRQLSEWFGPDCSLRRCPSGDDPYTSIDETKCTGINQLSSTYPEKGHIGNYCHVDCANRGVCDYSTGTCTCFDGHYGDNCAIISRSGKHTVAELGKGHDRSGASNVTEGVNVYS